VRSISSIGVSYSNVLPTDCVTFGTYLRGNMIVEYLDTITKPYNRLKGFIFMIF